ncbi:MAG: S-layer homology domain-containing protein [Desulfobacteraceae bacterium]
MYTCIALFLVLCATGCASRQAPSLGVLDSPAHHVMNGVKLMEKGRLEAAQREFQSALRLDPRCAAAFRGNSLIHGMRQEYVTAFEAIHQAIRNTTPEDLRDPVNGAFNDCCRKRKHELWPQRSNTEEMPVTATSFVVRFLNTYYLLGVSYGNESEYEERYASLLASLVAAQAFSETAAERLARARDLTRYFPESGFARGLAFSVRITRAEGAGLLVRELDVEALPGVKESVEENAAPWPQDLLSHPLKEEIGSVLNLGLDGFPLFENGNFRPETPWSRAEFAEAVVDILRRTGRISSESKEGPQLSPFEDVPLSASYLKAVAVCTEDGFLEAEGGKVRPNEPLSGGEALRGIHRLKKYLTGKE